MPTFYSYTAAELQGSGSLISAHLNQLSSKTPYVFHLPSDYSGSIYFTLETVRNANQVYDSASPKPFLNKIFPIYQTVDMVKSDYIASFVLANGDNRFVIFIDTNPIDGTKVYLRATGNINLVIEQTDLAKKIWNNTTENWDEYSSLWGV
jgi:hypothetical protein